MRRNPTNPKRTTAANQRRTQARVDQYYGKRDLLQTWESQPDEVQAENHDYILKLRAMVRTVRNYVLHRASPESDIL